MYVYVANRGKLKSSLVSNAHGNVQANILHDLVRR